MQLGSVSCRKLSTKEDRQGSRRVRRQMPPDVDQVVCDHAQSDPPSHAQESVIATARQSMAAFENTDPSFTSGPPLLPLLEPTLLLPSAPFGAARIPIRNRHILHTHGLRGFLIRLRVETGISCHPSRNRPNLRRCASTAGISRCRSLGRPANTS